MMLLGSIVNAIAIVGGSAIGALAKKGIQARFSEIVITSLALFTFYMGMSSVLGTKQPLVVVISLVLGSIIGEYIDIDKKFNQLGNQVQKKLVKGSKNGKVGEAFVSASLVFCIGSMAIMGGLQSGLMQDHTTLYTKAFLDGVFALFFSSTMGIGVALSAVPVFVYQGAITLLASFLVPYLSQPVITEMSATGGILLMALAFTMLEIKKVKVANMIPAMFLPILLMLFVR